MTILEAALDKKSVWYFGNNRAKNLRLSPPKWHAPFFLTTSYSYAEEYSDYGVYTIDLKHEATSKILDFSTSEAEKLKWPTILIDKIREGQNDLNSLAYDMYILAFNTGESLMYIDDSKEWQDAADYFKAKSKGIMKTFVASSTWGESSDHAFVLQMWKDIQNAGFDGFMHNEFGKKILALFDFKCMDKISVKPVKAVVNEKLKSRALRKAFNARGQAAFPSIASDDDIVFVSGIPKGKALKLLKKACHDVSSFHPEYMKKAIRWSDDQIFGVFNKHDKRNVLAMASVSYSGESSAAYLHEMTGFIKGGYGKKLVELLMRKFKKIYGQIALEGSGTEADPFKPNGRLRDKFYATIPGLKIYRVETSIWDCPADFFYYGISDESIKELLEKTYGKSGTNLQEDCEGNDNNIKQIFDEVASKYKDLFGFDLSYMRFKVDSQPVYTNGDPCYQYDSDECAGDWTELGWIRLNPDMKSVMDRYGVAWHRTDDINQFTKFIIAHELAHEVWHNIADDQFKEQILDDARRQSFSTAYLDTVAPNKLPEETFCEYLADKIVKQQEKFLREMR